MLYPGASRAQWFGDEYPGVDMGGVDKVLLHTTETGSWPGYGGGASAPTLTYHPTRHEWRQHFHLERSARALRDPSGTVVRENRDRVCQVEIVCSCDRAFASRYGYPHVTELDDRALADLGAFVRFMHDTFGVPLVAAPRWLPYPDSYGDSPARMTGPEYDAFRGVLGHQHASGNTHGDPGALDIARIMAHAGGEDEDPMALFDTRAEFVDAVVAAIASTEGRAAVRQAVAGTPVPHLTDPDASPVTLTQRLNYIQADARAALAALEPAALASVIGAELAKLPTGSAPTQEQVDEAVAKAFRAAFAG